MAKKQVNTSLGSKFRRFAKGLGSKLKTVAELGAKFVGDPLGSINRGLHSLSTKLGLAKVAKQVAGKLREIGNTALKFLPPEQRTLVEGIWDMTPVGQAVNVGLYSADVMSGRKDLSDEQIQKIFPEWAKIRHGLDMVKSIAMPDRVKLKKIAREEATRYAIGLLKASSAQQPTQ